MDNFWLKYKLLHPDAKKPYLATKDSIGYDFYAIQDILIPAARPFNEYIPFEEMYPGIKKVRTGLAIQFPLGWGGFINDKSSMGAKGIHCFAGVIDPGYTGEILVVLANFSSTNHLIKKGDRFVQICFHPVGISDPEEVLEFAKTERGVGGFGSTGVK